MFNRKEQLAEARQFIQPKANITFEPGAKCSDCKKEKDWKFSNFKYKGDVIVHRFERLCIHCFQERLMLLGLTLQEVNYKSKITK